MMLLNSKGRMGLAVLVACALICGAATADEKSKDKSGNSKDGKSSRQNQIPEALQKLNLSEKQKDQIRDIEKKYDSRFEDAWKRFDEAHLQIVGAEATLNAAFEDQLNDSQKQKLRDMRKKDAEESKRNDQSASNKSQPERRTALKPESGNSQGKDNSSQPQGIILYEVTISGSPEQMRELGLEGNQQQQCDKVCQQFHSKLRHEWRELHAAHRQLVQIETEKLEQIEKVLTKDQLQDLRQQRSKPEKDSDQGNKSKNSDSNSGKK